MPSKFVKIVVFVPETDAERVREALGKARAGSIGNYSYCSFSSKGVGSVVEREEKPEYYTTGRINQQQRNTQWGS